MYDIHVMLPDNPGTLGQFGSLMGRAGVSLEGGGMFTLGGAGHAHFLVEDGAAAARWFKLVHLRMPVDLRRHIFGADRLSLSRAEALTGFSRRTLKRHLPKGGWW